MTHAGQMQPVTINNLQTMSKDMSRENADETLARIDGSLQAIAAMFEPSAEIEDLAEHLLESVYGLARSLTACAEPGEVEDARAKVAASLSAFEAGLASASPKTPVPEFKVSGAGVA